MLRCKPLWVPQEGGHRARRRSLRPSWPRGAVLIRYLLPGTGGSGGTMMYLEQPAGVLVLCAAILAAVSGSMSPEENCQLRPVIHVLKQPGCQPKPIPSFACQGSCSSYVQVSGSRYWQVERSCMCCQEMGEREATKAVFCPNGPGPKFRKVVTRAPVECMCRPCTSPDEASVLPQELVTL